jgi:hypothetical protein
MDGCTLLLFAGHTRASPAPPADLLIRHNGHRPTHSHPRVSGYAAAAGAAARSHFPGADPVTPGSTNYGN